MFSEYVKITEKITPFIQDKGGFTENKARFAPRMGGLITYGKCPIVWSNRKNKDYSDRFDENGFLVYSLPNPLDKRMNNRLEKLSKQGIAYYYQKIRDKCYEEYHLLLQIVGITTTHIIFKKYEERLRLSITVSLNDDGNIND